MLYRNNNYYHFFKFVDKDIIMNSEKSARDNTVSSDINLISYIVILSYIMF